MSSDSSEGTTADELPDALKKLLARIETRAALPGLSGSARAVQRLARDDGARLQSLAAAVVGDPGLSHRLLRSSNAAHFLPTGAGSIASIQRAIAVLGFDAVQLLSKALRALEAVPGGVTDRLVRHELMRSTLAGTLAVCLTTDGRRLEETQLTAMFQNLGRMLVAVHLPDEALAVRARVPKAHWPRASLEQSASRELLGMEFGHIGQHVARLWGWPERLRSAMARQPWPASRISQPGARLRWIAQCANDLADLMLDCDPQRWAAGCDELAEQTRHCLGLDAKALQDAMSEARQDLQDLAGQVGLPVEQHPSWQASDPVTAEPAPSATSTQDRDPGTEDAGATEHPSSADATDPALPRSVPDSQHLTQAALRLTSDLLDRKTRSALPSAALSALHVGLGARRAMLWRRRPSGAALQMVKTLGPSLPDTVASSWTVDPAKGKDLFSRLCATGNLSLIHDASRTDIAPHLPAAFRQHSVARCFMVLPIAVQGRTLGMIYLDRPDHDPFVLDGEAMQLVRTLRDQTALAWNEAG